MLILLPSLGWAFFLFYIVENPELCPVQRRNGTVAPTMPPTMPPTLPPTETPSFSPTLAPSMAPSDPMAISDNPWDFAWLANASANGNVTPSNITGTMPPNITETFAPNITETLPPNVTETFPPKISESIEEFLVCPGLGASAS